MVHGACSLRHEEFRRKKNGFALIMQGTRSGKLMENSRRINRQRVVNVIVRLCMPTEKRVGRVGGEQRVGRVESGESREWERACASNYNDPLASGWHRVLRLI